MSDSARRSRGSRRRFLGWVGLAGVAAATAPAAALVSAATPAKKSGGRRAAPPKAEAPPATPALSEDALALGEIVRRRYGAHLAPEQLAGVTREIEQRLAGGKALRAVKLANADEPDVTFEA